MSRQRQFQPPVRVAPPRELKAYVVYEHQLDQLAQGLPAALMLNLSLFFLGVAMTAFGTLFSLAPSDDRGYYTFLLIFLVTLIAGVVLLLLWRSSFRSMTGLVDEIKSQMPPNVATQTPTVPTTTIPPVPPTTP